MAIADKQEEREAVLQTALREQVASNLGKGPWIIVADLESAGMDRVAFYCALVPNRYVKECLSTDEWDLHVGAGGPSVWTHRRGNREVRRYERSGKAGKVEPLVYCRDFYGIRPSGFEVCEDYRLFHNLYHDVKTGALAKITDSGNEEEVVRIQSKRVEFRAKELREYLGIRRMHLAVFFECIRYSAFSLADLGLEETRTVVKGKDHIYSVCLTDAMAVDDEKTLSAIRGKKLIAGVAAEGRRVRKEKYDEFVIRVDEKGEPVAHTCEPDRLANYFGANPGSPQYVTPVFFRREVLQKYYAQPGKYSVEDGYLRCSGLWGMRIDNDHPKYVIALLGDLGRDLPEEERSYWKSFNVPPEGGMSRTAFKRGFLAEPANPERSDLAFKHRFEQFQQKWNKAIGWPLFKPPHESDEHYFIALRIPTTDDQAEFDGQVLALAKILVDSLNEEKFERAGIQVGPDTKGIGKLEAFFQLKGLDDFDSHTQFLRDLYALRSAGVGHRKSKNFVKAAAKFGLPDRGNIAAFEEILARAEQFLEYLEERLLPHREGT